MLAAIDWNTVVGDVLASVLGVVVLALLAIFRAKLFEGGQFVVQVFKGLAEIPGMQEKIDQVHHEVHPNKGKSIPDRVGRLEDADKKQSDQLSLLLAFGKQLIDSREIAAVQCTADGDVEWVSDRWTVLAGLSAERAVAWGWAEAIAEKDVQRVKDAWRDALRDKSSLVITFRFRTGAEVRSTTRPIYNGNRLIGWRATLEEYPDRVNLVQH